MNALALRLYKKFLSDCEGESMMRSVLASLSLLTLRKEIPLMAQDQTKPLKPSIITDDRDSLAAVQKITDYAPANSDYSTQSLLDSQADMDAKITAAVQAEADFKAKRDDAVAATHRFHNRVVGMRDSVGAQYGKDSNQFQSVGRKKTTEYKKRPSGNRTQGAQKQ